ncbi:MAG: peptidoglycan editing factor PgeF [Candidatus Rhabdochlamydia sp.]
MLYHEKEGARWLTFEIFEPFGHLLHAVFLKDENNHISCRDSLKDLIKTAIPYHSLSSLYQVHQDLILKAPVDKMGLKADGMITQEVKAALQIGHADCQAAIFYDPIHHVLGVAHAGWRGQVSQMYQKMIRMMQKTYGSAPSDLHVAISPSLGPCCAQFINHEQELPSAFRDFEVKPLYFNLWEIARWQLTSSGILPSHIQIAGICTCCDPNHYFSYRRDHTSQRHFTVALLNESKEMF